MSTFWWPKRAACPTRAPPSLHDEIVREAEALKVVVPPQALVHRPIDQVQAEAVETARIARRDPLQPGTLKGTAATLTCASTMCRLELADADDANVDRATSAVAEQMPKRFGATAVYPTGHGERTLYVAKSNADLRWEEPVQGTGREIAVPPAEKADSPATAK